MPSGRTSVILIGMDYEYEGEEPYESRVLWGRVGVYAASLVLVFALGSCVGGRGTVPDSEFQALREEAAQLSRDKEILQQQVDSVSSGGLADDAPRISTPDEEGDGTTDADGSAGTSSTGDGETRTYLVQPGDTLTAIASRMYGDPQKFTLIQDANDLEGQLVVGQELIIPPDE